MWSSLPCILASGLGIDVLWHLEGVINELPSAESCTIAAPVFCYGLLMR